MIFVRPSIHDDISLFQTIFAHQSISSIITRLKLRCSSVEPSLDLSVRLRGRKRTRIEDRSVASNFRAFKRHSSKTRLIGQCTVGQNDQEYRLKYWAIRWSIHSFACTAHSFACSELLAWLAHSAVLTRLLACSLVGQ